MQDVQVIFRHDLGCLGPHSDIYVTVEIEALVTDDAELNERANPDVEYLSVRAINYRRGESVTFPPPSDLLSAVLFELVSEDDGIRRRCLRESGVKPFA